MGITKGRGQNIVRGLKWSIFFQSAQKGVQTLKHGSDFLPCPPGLWVEIPVRLPHNVLWYKLVWSQKNAEFSGTTSCPPHFTAINTIPGVLPPVNVLLMDGSLTGQEHSSLNQSVEDHIGYAENTVEIEGRQPHPVRQLWAHVSGSSGHHFCGGAAETDGTVHRSLSCTSDIKATPIIMRYTYEYKRKCVELYREGKWPETPEGVSDKSFRDKVRLWVRAEDSRGPEALKHKNFNRNWTPEERLELVSQVMSGKSCVSVAIEAGIQDRLLYQWVQNYKTKGYNGLVEMKKRSSK